ncbi:hypothetical protein AOH238_11380 [Helicobacter pylori]
MLGFRSDPKACGKNLKLSWLKKADEKKIEQLFDSILRGYPIGSFLFWKLQKEDIAKSDEQDENKLNFQLYQLQITMSESLTMKKSILNKSRVMICLLSWMANSA